MKTNEIDIKIAEFMYGEKLSKNSIKSIHNSAKKRNINFLDVVKEDVRLMTKASKILKRDFKRTELLNLRNRNMRNNISEDIALEWIYEIEKIKPEVEKILNIKLTTQQFSNFKRSSKNYNLCLIDYAKECKRILDKLSKKLNRNFEISELHVFRNNWQNCGKISEDEAIKSIYSYENIRPKVEKILDIKIINTSKWSNFRSSAKRKNLSEIELAKEQKKLLDKAKEIFEDFKYEDIKIINNISSRMKVSNYEYLDYLKYLRIDLPILEKDIISRMCEDKSEGNIRSLWEEWNSLKENYRYSSKEIWDIVSSTLPEYKNITFIYNYEEIKNNKRLCKKVWLKEKDIEDGNAIAWVILDKNNNYIYSAQTVDIKNERNLIKAYEKQDRDLLISILGKEREKRIDQILSYGKLSVYIHHIIDSNNYEAKDQIMIEESIMDMKCKICQNKELYSINK